MPERTQTPACPPASPTAPSAAAEVASSALLNGARELRIQHGDQTYRLCHTRNNKLILIK